MSDDKTSLPEVVRSYLLEHPDFLSDHPEILESLQLSHDSGHATSLIERQVAQLRAANEELKHEMSRMLQIASENEQLMSRLHRLTLDLMSIGSRSEFFTRLGHSLLNDFNADILQICLFDPQAAQAAGADVLAVAADDPALEPFRAHLDKGRVFCGRLAEGKLDFLFGSKARWVQSTALIPLGEHGSDGMMAIGSSDPSRFYPGMGTLFLDLLADVISARIAVEEPAAERRSA